MPIATDPTTEQVLTVARLAAAHADADEDALVALLRDAGFEAADAERAVVLVPSAFARPVLVALGVTNLPATYQVEDRRGRWHERPLAEEPWFRAALVVAASVQAHGYGTEGCTGPTPTRAEFEAVLELSPEMNVSGQALDRGIQLGGATLHPLQVYRWRLPDPAPWWRAWSR